MIAYLINECYFLVWIVKAAYSKMAYLKKYTVIFIFTPTRFAFMADISKKGLLTKGTSIYLGTDDRIHLRPA